MLSIACSIPGFVDSDEAPALDRLIETYQDREEEEFHECCDNAVFKTLDNEVKSYSNNLYWGLVSHEIVNYMSLCNYRPLDLCIKTGQILLVSLAVL